MTPITVPVVTDAGTLRRTRWLMLAAGAVIGAFFALAIESGGANPVGITPMIVQVGNHLCRQNEGLKTIYRHGRASNVYSWHCHNAAEFNEITATQMTPHELIREHGAVDYYKELP